MSFLRHFVIFLVLEASVCAFSHAQSPLFIRGTVVSRTDNKPLPQASVLLFRLPDSTLIKGFSTGLDGSFEEGPFLPGQYALRCSYVGFQTYWQRFQLSSGLPPPIFNIVLQPDPQALRQVDIEGRQIVAMQKGDTLEINAAAFKVNPDATAEDLVTKMPGISVEGGRLRAQGEEVRRVLLDGREFFGDDATLALRNLPADIVDRVQIFDRPSEQAQFTGFNDGNTEKTLNIRTRRGMSNGQFGKFYAGSGTHWRYNAGLTYNNFKDDQRLTVLGISNNINQQNFAMQDLLGLAGMSPQQGPGRMMSIFGGMRPPGSSAPGFGGGPLMNSPAANFMTTQQAGINTTHALGVNYQDDWGKKARATAYYFFNHVTNNMNRFIRREFFSSDSLSPLKYQETAESRSRNMNHRAGLRLEYKADSTHSFIWNPTFSLQHNVQDYGAGGAFFRIDPYLLSSTDNVRHSRALATTINNDVLYRFRFRKKGRTLSINAVHNHTFRQNDGSLNATNRTYQPDSLFINNQTLNGRTQGLNVSGNLTYTEPLASWAQGLLTYTAAWSQARNQRYTHVGDTLSAVPYRIDSLLSNRLQYGQLIHRPGLGLNMALSAFNLSLGVDYQYSYLDVHQSFPLVPVPRKFFHNVLPKGSLQIRFGTRGQLRVFYNTSTQIPSVAQLQATLDNSNPLAPSAGNPNLRQTFTHNAGYRFHISDSSRTRTFHMFLNFNEVRHYIANAQLITDRDTLLEGWKRRLPAGAQFTSPVNMHGYRTLRTFMGMSFPLPFIKCNLNLMAGGLWTRTPGLINGEPNVNNTVNTNTGFVLTSNLGERWDFRVSYAANYNIVTNKLRPASNNNFYTGVASVQFTLLPWKGLVLNSELFYNHFIGLQQGFNNNFVLWNAGVGYKFLKNRTAELRLSAFDLLRSNVSIARQVTESYLEDVNTNLLQRYLMVTFTYTLKKFGFRGNFKTAPEPYPASLPQENPK
ncbi:MAG: outer membrane beta-barrel protein [Flavobacteriales bacterium]|nr:outer membrane beta-barrel protein [Flavobacteriales bacterium]